MAFTTATFTRLYTNAAGVAIIVLTYTGNAGEAPVVYEYPQDLKTMPTADFIRAIAMDRLANLNTTKNFIAGATPFVGTVLDTTTPLPTPAASPFGQFIVATAPFTPGTIPTDIFTIYGSATKTVIVNKISIFTVQTTAGINIWNLIKRSTANTGGTSAALTGVPLSSAFPVSTAAVKQYSVNPTGLGTSLGSLWSGRILAPTISTATAGLLETPLLVNATFLSGVSQGLAVNFGGAALPAGLSCQIIATWSEQ